MAKADFPKDVYEISGRDFWSHLHVPAGAPGGEALAKAIRLGRAGRKTRAYAALAEFHRIARRESWQMALETAGRRSLLNAAEARKLARKPIGLVVCVVDDLARSS